MLLHSKGESSGLICIGRVGRVGGEGVHVRQSSVSGGHFQTWSGSNILLALFTPALAALLVARRVFFVPPLAAAAVAASAFSGPSRAAIATLVVTAEPAAIVISVPSRAAMNDAIEARFVSSVPNLDTLAAAAVAAIVFT